MQRVGERVYSLSAKVDNGYLQRLCKGLAEEVTRALRECSDGGAEGLGNHHEFRGRRPHKALHNPSEFENTA